MTWSPGTTVTFAVRALAPVAKGNLVAYLPRGQKRPVVTDRRGPAIKQWEARLREAGATALAAAGLTQMRERPCDVHLVLWLVRPRGDFRRDGGLLGTARTAPWCKPDIDKLQRTVFDALSQCVIDDDSRICRVVVEKRYVDSAAQAGVAVRVTARAATIREASQCAPSNS